MTEPFPLQEDTLCRFVAFLAQEGLKHRSIKSYLSGLRFAQIHHAQGNPFDKPLPRLEYVLAGVKRAEAHANTSQRSRLPITLDLLKKLQAIWLAPPTHPDNIMLWAASCTGFFGFLRAGEFTVPSAQAYDPEVHLNLGDMAVDSHVNPTLIRLHIKQSKTDPFRQGVDIYLGKTGATVCPVQALVNYLAQRCPDPGPLFVFSSDAPLTRSALVARLQTALEQAGLSRALLAQYNGHSFRIGAATTAAQQGLEDSLIQTLGRWKSAAYKIYIKIPRSRLADISQVLARPQTTTPQ